MRATRELSKFSLPEHFQEAGRSLAGGRDEKWDVTGNLKRDASTLRSTAQPSSSQHKRAFYWRKRGDFHGLMRFTDG